MARYHLEEALRTMRQLGSSLEYERLKASTMLAELLLAERRYGECLEVRNKNSIHFKNPFYFQFSVLICYFKFHF